MCYITRERFRGGTITRKKEEREYRRLFTGDAHIRNNRRRLMRLLLELPPSPKGKDKNNFPIQTTTTYVRSNKNLEERGREGRRERDRETGEEEDGVRGERLFLPKIHTRENLFIGAEGPSFLSLPSPHPFPSPSSLSSSSKLRSSSQCSSLWREETIFGGEKEGVSHCPLSSPPPLLAPISSM